MKPRVAIWCAVSSPRQAHIDKDSLPLQEKDGIAYASVHDASVVAVYQVPGHSRRYGFLHEAEQDIEAYRRLHEDCNAQAFDVLWCRERSRLGRTRALIAQVEYLVTEIGGAEVLSAKMPHRVGQHGSREKLISAIEGWEAEDEIDQLVERYLFGIQGRVKRGLHPSNWPHGYRGVKNGKGKTAGAEFVPGEIEAVELATSLFLQGVGYGEIAQALNASPWRPRRASGWRLSTVRGMMLNDVYAGIISFKDTMTPEPSEHFLALWDPETHSQIIRERGRRKRGGSPRVSPVSGILVCNRCGWVMAAIGRKTYVAFRCAKHQRAYINGEPCHNNIIREDTVIDHLEKGFRELATPGALEEALEAALPGRLALEDAVGQAQQQVEAIKERKRRIVRAIHSGVISDDAETREVALELEEALTAAQTQLHMVRDRLTKTPDQDAQRSALAYFITHPDLRAEPMDQVRARLQQAGVKVYVEDRQIVRVAFGGTE